MADDFFEKLHQIENLAEADEIYQAYKHTYDDLNRWFQKFIRIFPLNIKQKLIAHGDYLELMHRRTLGLVCENMDFIKNEGAE